MKRNVFIWAIVVLIIYLGFQFVLIQSVHLAQYDESIFLDVARNISRTGLPVRSVGAGKLYLDETPLYPYLLGGLGLVFKENILLFRLVTVAFGASTVLLVFFIGQKLRSISAGVASGLVLAVHPFFGVYSFFIRMEIFMCFFLILALYFLIQEEEHGGRGYLIGASLAVMTAVLFKVLAVAFWGAVILYIIVRASGWRRRLTELLWVGAPTAVGIIAWLSLSLLEPGQFEARLDRWRGAVTGVGTVVDPRLNVAAWAWLKTIGGSILGWEIVALLLIGLVAYLFTKRKRLRIIGLLWLYIAVAVTLSVIMQLKEPRHVIGLIPVTAVAIGLMINWAGLLKWLQQRRIWTGTAVVIAFLFLWSLSPLKLPPLADYQQPASWWEPIFANRIFHNDQYFTPLKEMGLYLEEHSPKDSVIIVMRQGPIVGYYADRSYMFLYTRPFEENLELLKNNEFLVVDSIEFRQQTPEQTEQLLQYIEDHFEIEQTVARVMLYRKK